jgi:hypothetical protein
MYAGGVEKEHVLRNLEGQLGRWRWILVSGAEPPANRAISQSTDYAIARLGQGGPDNNKVICSARSLLNPQSNRRPGRPGSLLIGFSHPANFRSTWRYFISSAPRAIDIRYKTSG